MITDKDEALKEVGQYGLALKYISKTLRNDKDVVTAAVRQNGWALQYASEELRDDKDVVSVAIQKELVALAYASERLRAGILSMVPLGDSFEKVLKENLWDLYGS